MSNLHTYITQVLLLDIYIYQVNYHISPWKKKPPFHILQFVYQSAAIYYLKVLSNPFAYLSLSNKRTHRFSITIFCTLSFRSAVFHKGIVATVGSLFSNTCITDRPVGELKDFNLLCSVSLLEVYYINNFI